MTRIYQGKVRKKVGLRKPRAEVIVALRQRLGSSQPIVAARLVLIRDLLMNTSAEKFCPWKEAGRGLASPQENVPELSVNLSVGLSGRPSLAATKQVLICVA